ncbi:MAG TPA: sigma-70 family RNA polymerase sigma factor [Thermoanaerobaculia bacterium]
MSDEGLDSSPHPPAAASPDRPLLDAIRDGDRKEIARFVDLHADAVYRFVHHRLDRPEALDDLVQEIFLAAWRALPHFRGESEVGTWLLGIARHKIGDYYRDRLRNLDLSAVIDEDSLPESLRIAPTVDERIDGQRREARTRQILSTLPDPYRAVLVWRYWDQRSSAEMAAISGHTEKSIERLLARARALFRRRWNDG